MQAVFFDMDGVLLDSEPVKLDDMRRFLLHKGVTLSPAELDGLLGISDEQTMTDMIARHGWPQTADECIAEMRLFCGQPYLRAENLRPFAGLAEFLREVRARGLKTGVVSSTDSYGILAALNRFMLMPLFDVAVTSDFVGQKKPAPEPYLRAAAFAGAAPEQCAVIEDSPAGIRAGKAAGMYVVGFTGSVIRQDVGAADERAASYAALIKRLDAWQNRF